jgi:hypothetical protein
MYIPESGRWLTLDPSHEDGGQESTSPYGYVFDDPINHTDPDGKLPHVVAGAIVGGLIGGAIEIGTQLYKGESVNLRAVGGATLRGAIVGGTAAATGGLSLGAMALSGAAANAVGGAIDNKIQGKVISTESVTKDALIGAAGGAAGKIVSKVVDKLPNHIKGKIGEAVTEAKYLGKGYVSQGKAIVPTGGRTATGRVQNAVYDHQMKNVISISLVSESHRPVVMCLTDHFKRTNSRTNE